MSHFLTVEVLDSDGDPIENAPVKIRIKEGGLLGFTGGWLGPERTDETGHAEFETSQDYDDDHKLTIHVRGQEFGPYRIGRGSYTVTLE
jgi:hypothetical protein